MNNTSANRLMHRIQSRRAGVHNTIVHHSSVNKLLASNAQQRLWFISQIDVNAPTYSVPLAFHIKGHLSLQRFDMALSKIVARHEIFRTALIEENGVLWQKILDPMQILSAIHTATDFDGAIHIANCEASIPFNLSQPPLLRSICISISPNNNLLVLLIHHVVSDAWSLGIFFEDLKKLYELDEILPPLKIQYSDFTDWQRTWLNSPQADIQRAYWCKDLKGCALNLPIRKSAIKSFSQNGELLTFHWEKRLSIKVQHIAAYYGTTEFVVLLAGYFVLLHRYTLQEDIIVGVPVACRSLPETEKLIGYFTNTLPIRSNISGEFNFEEVLLHVKGKVLNGLSYQDLPLDQIVESLKLERDTNFAPLFQTLFVMQNTPVETKLHIDGLSIEEVIIHTNTAKVDVSISIQKNDSGLEGYIEYNSDLFDQSWAKQFLECFKYLIENITNSPKNDINDLALGLNHNIFEQYQQKTEKYTFEDAITLFETQAGHTPDAVAITADGQSLTYAELNIKANQLAWKLKEKKINHNPFIGIYLDRSADLVIALLAVLKCGLVFIPLDTAFPLKRIRQICLEATPFLILTQKHHFSYLAQLNCEMVAVEEELTSYPVDNLNIKNNSNEIMYIYYTSGSTGTPKGVVIEHRCAMNRLQWLRRRYPLSVGDCVLHKTPLIFDVSIWEIFLPLFAGATIVMASKGCEADIFHISDLINTKPIVLMHFVPSMLEAFLNTNPSIIHSRLKWVVLSGESPTANLYKNFSKYFAAELHNHYGQTETSEVAAWEGKAINGTIPIGKPIGIYNLYILDNNFSPVPRDIPGEVYVEGLGGLARCYFANPVLTAQSFVPNPYATIAGDRLYRSGDIARFNQNGVIEFLGRLDHQIKIRGCRVDVREVEATLLNHSSVKSCVVTTKIDDSGSNYLVAYVIGTYVTASELDTYLKEIVPKFMLPTVYIFLAEFPRTHSGKIDYHNLPAPIAEDFFARCNMEEAQTALEKDIVLLWQETLGPLKIGRTDDFFAIGGNSLKSAHVLSKISQIFGISISIRDFFNSPTVKNLATIIEGEFEKQLSTFSDNELRQLLGELNNEK